MCSNRFARQPARSPRPLILLLAACSAAFFASHGAADTIDWSNPSGGNFNLGSNWAGSAVPGANDIANFALPGTGSTYTVSLSSNTTIKGASISRDTVTLNLNNKQFSAIGASGIPTLLVGQTAGESASLSLSGGTLTTTPTSAAAAIIGSVAGASGALTLGASTLVLDGELDVGLAGNGTLTQSAGSLLLNSDSLVVGRSTASTGTYNLTGGTLSGTFEWVGYNGTGTFNQNSGDNQTYYLHIGVYAGSTGTYNMSGGNLKLLGGSMAIGVSGNGTFNISAGTHTADYVWIATEVDGQGIYHMDGPSANASIQILSVGGTNLDDSPGRAGGTGQLQIANGLITVNKLLHVYPGSSIALSGGTLSASILDNYGTISFTGNPATLAGTLNNVGLISAQSPAARLTGTLVNSGSITATNSGVLNFSGVFTNNGTYNNAGTLISSINISNTGAFIQSGPQTWSPGSAFINTGTATFASDAGSPVAAPLSINIPAGTITFSATQHLNTLSLSNNGIARVAQNAQALLIPSTLTFAGSTDNWTGTLDLTNNTLLIKSPDLATKNIQLPILQNLLLSGKHNGDYQGPGITSSTILTTPNTSLALADNADLHYTSFHGQPVDDNSLLITQATFGDATLNNKVDALDLNLLAAHWQQQSNALWSAGDFNTDGKVDALDLNLLASHWQSGTASLEAAFAALPVPEPLSLTILALSLPVLGLRRRGG